MFKKGNATVWVVVVIIVVLLLIWWAMGRGETPEVAPEETPAAEVVAGSEAAAGTAVEIVAGDADMAAGADAELAQ